MIFEGQKKRALERLRIRGADEEVEAILEKAIVKDNGKVMVGLMSTERMDVPPGKDDKMFCSEAYLDFILSKANFMLERGKEKLKRFGYELKALD